MFLDFGLDFKNWFNLDTNLDSKNQFICTPLFHAWANPNISSLFSLLLTYYASGYTIECLN
jgi:hypothetical protein